IQQWIALPVIVEKQMGDLPPGSVSQSLDITTVSPAQDNNQNFTSPPPSGLRSPSNNAPFYSQLSTIPQAQARHDLRSPAHTGSQQYNIPQAQELGASSLNMGSMVGALPDYGPVESGQNNPQIHQQTQRPLSGASTSALVYQLQQISQLPSHASSSLPIHSPYGHGFVQDQYQQSLVSAQSPQHGNFAPFHANQQRPTGPTSLQHPYQNFQQPSQYMYYPSPYGPQGQYPQGFPPQAAHSQAMFGRRPSLSSGQVPIVGQNLDMPLHEGNYPHTTNLIPGVQQAETGPVGAILSGGPIAPGTSIGASSIPRGPPRKPKQSGHALWVGNLPPGTTVMDLKDHFSRDATKDIESLFLISKSNCAFVNYRTEASCAAAMHRFHDSRFHGVRLVCRLRRSSAPASGVPTGPSAMLGDLPSNTSPPRSPQVAEVPEEVGEAAEPSPRQSGEENVKYPGATEKYFIVKSLTLQDLELSVRNGIWATQSHNEEVLNKAYKSANNVYLIFSANKSGEYFGYARMASPILEDATHLVGNTPKPENLDATDIPKSIPTPATEFAPKGRIIDDSARGTIFWEAELSDASGDEGDNEKEEIQAEPDSSTVAQSWGKPFKIEWISTNRLPFYRTRGLRNPWNANREVKIARDGTELETSVGERLIQMFDRLGPSSAGGSMAQSPQQMTLPQMRPY
ncbi:hypothetical protein K469DRAFT_599061, partial [Zopfia rhizophila CBS 207.26]